MGVIRDTADQGEGLVGGEGEGSAVEEGEDMGLHGEEILEGLEDRMAILQDPMAAEGMAEEVVRRGMTHRVHLKNVADTRPKQFIRHSHSSHRQLLYLCVFNATSTHEDQRVMWGVRTR